MIMVVYLWSRRNPDEHLNLLGLFTISASYLAYVLLGFTILLGGRCMFPNRTQCRFHRPNNAVI